MDPTANLTEQRRIAERVMSGTLSVEALAECAARLAELALDLDTWISRGGFLPEPWAGLAGVHP